MNYPIEPILKLFIIFYYQPAEIKILITKSIV